MSIIHLSQQRFDFLCTQGYSFDNAASGVGGSGVELTFHLLPAERAICTSCGTEFTSVDACSPAELETIRTCMEFHRDPAEFLRDGRQHMADFVRRVVMKEGGQGNQHVL